MRGWIINTIYYLPTVTNRAVPLEWEWLGHISLHRYVLNSPLGRNIGKENKSHLLGDGSLIGYFPINFPVEWLMHVVANAIRSYCCLPSRLGTPNEAMWIQSDGIIDTKYWIYGYSCTFRAV